MSEGQKTKTPSRKQQEIPAPLSLPADVSERFSQEEQGLSQPAPRSEAQKGPRRLGRRFYGITSFFERNFSRIVTVFIIVAVLVGAVFYALDGEPICSSIIAQFQQASQSTADATEDFVYPEPAYVILGQHKDKIFSYNSGVGELYEYESITHTERSVCRLAQFDAFHWHESGKVVLVSRAHNILGNIYALNVISQTKSTCEPILVTDRESMTGFPRNLRVDASLPLAWSETGEKIAFVAQDTQDEKESLFIYDLNDEKLIYTPARNLDRITSIVWVNADQQLTLVVINDGQEGRHFVDADGGGFAPWEVLDP
jgi:hypothetical protein